MEHSRAENEEIIIKIYAENLRQHFSGLLLRSYKYGEARQNQTL